MEIMESVAIYRLSSGLHPGIFPIFHNYRSLSPPHLKDGVISSVQPLPFEWLNMGELGKRTKIFPEILQIREKNKNISWNLIKQGKDGLFFLFFIIITDNNYYR